MVSLKRTLLLFAVVLFAVAPFTLVAAEDGHAEAPKSQAEEIQEYSQHHLQDDHYFSLFTDKNAGKHYEIGRDTSELQSRENLVCRLLLEKKKKQKLL